MGSEATDNTGDKDLPEWTRTQATRRCEGAGKGTTSGQPDPAEAAQVTNSHTKENFAIG